MSTPADRLPPGNQTGGTERQGSPATAGAVSLRGMETARDDNARRDLRGLAERVDRLEAVLLRLVSLAAAGLIITGLLLPYASFKEGGEQYDASLLTIGFTAGRADAFFAVAFLGLLLVAAAALIFLTMVTEVRAASYTEERIGILLGWLVLLSAGGAGLMALLLTRGDRPDVGPGLLVYAAGAVLTFLLLASKKGRDFWVADRRHDLPV